MLSENDALWISNISLSYSRDAVIAAIPELPAKSIVTSNVSCESIESGPFTVKRLSDWLSNVDIEVS